MVYASTVSSVARNSLPSLAEGLVKCSIGGTLAVTLTAPEVGSSP
jgi:hypothetical protein